MSVFHQHWQPKGHTFGSCMSLLGADLMYVNIPKNASSWTKPNLQDFKWEFYNYHYDHLYKRHAMIVLRDPVDRWLSGICEYFALYHADIDVSEFTPAFYRLIFDQITFDDHTEKQVYFIEGLDTENCTFFMCDENYRKNFTDFLQSRGLLTRNYSNYDYQHTTEGSNVRTKFKNIFKPLLDIPENRTKVQDHYKLDYELISKVKFYGSR